MTSDCYMVMVHSFISKHVYRAFLEILNSLPNCLKILEKCFLGTTCTVMYLAGSNVLSHYDMLPVFSESIIFELSILFCHYICHFVCIIYRKTYLLY